MEDNTKKNKPTPSEHRDKSQQKSQQHYKHGKKYPQRIWPKDSEDKKGHRF